MKLVEHSRAFILKAHSLQQRQVCHFFSIALTTFLILLSLGVGAQSKSGLNKYYHRSPLKALPLETLKTLESTCKDTDSLLHIKFVIAGNYYNSDEQMHLYFKDFLNYALELNDTFSYHLGSIFNAIRLINLRQYPEAHEKLTGSLNYFKDRDEHLWVVANIHLGFYHANKDELSPAFTYLKTAEKYCDTNDTKTYHNIINRLGILYNKIGETDKSVAYYQKIIDNCEQKGKCNFYFAALNNLMDRYLELGDTSRHLMILDTLISVNSNRKNAYANSKYYRHVISKYMLLNELEKIEPIVDSMVYFGYQKGNILLKVLSHDMAYNYYEKTSNAPKQIEHLKKMLAIAEKHDMPYFMSKSSYLLAKHYSTKNKHTIANNYWNTYAEVNKSIDNESKIKRFKETEIKLILDNNKLKNQSLENEAELLLSKNELQYTRLIVLSIMGFLLLLISIIIYRNYRSSLKSSKILEEKNEIIEKSLKEKELLLKEVHHRVKNNLQMVSGILSLQSQTIKDEKTRRAFIDGEQRIKSMALIHQNLYQDGMLNSVNTQHYFTRLVNNLLEGYTNKASTSIEANLNIEEHFIEVDQMLSLGLISNELISNSLKYAFKDKKEGMISFSFFKRDDNYHLVVADDGIGMEWPIKENNPSFGWKMINAFAEKVDAEVEVDTSNGTSVSLTYNTKKS